MNFCCHHTYNVFHLAQFIKFWQIFGIWILQELYLSSEKEKGSCWLAFTSSRNVSLGSFTLLACSGRKNCTKSIMHMQSCCFASLLNQLLLCGSHYCCCCRCLNPIFNFFPCRSQFGLKVIGHLLLPLIGFFTCVFDSVIVSKYKMHTHIRTVMPVCMN